MNEPSQPPIHDSALARRFWAKTNVANDRECWEWRGTRNRGYGMFSFSGKADRAHRIAWRLTNGGIPLGFFVCHTCDNPPCVNPRHLYLGTPMNNVQDRSARGHSGGLKGNGHPNAKLTSERVLEIRTRRGEDQRRLAEEFGVSQSTISAIMNRKAWTHI